VTARIFHVFLRRGFVNPIWIGVENRFIAGRVVVKGQTAVDALAILRARMAENRVVIMAFVPKACKFVWVPFRRDLLPLPTGSIGFARTTGAPLLSVFTVAKN
jgi:hypothetical protein